MAMKGLGDKSKAFVSASRSDNDSDESPEQLDLFPERLASPKTQCNNDDASFENHFVLHKVVHSQAAYGNCNKAVEPLHSKDDEVDGKQSFVSFVKSELNGSSLSPPRSAFMTQRIEFYSSSLSSIQKEYQGRPQMRLNQLDPSQWPSFLGDHSDISKTQIDRREVIKNSPVPPLKPAGLSQLKCPSSGMPSVYRGNQANLKVPLTRLSLIPVKHQELEEADEPKNLEEVISTTMSAVLVSSDDDKDDGMPCRQDESNFTPNICRPATAPAYNKFPSDSLEISNPKPSPTRCFLPFPIGKPSLGKTSLADNPALAKNTKPLRPSTAGPSQDSRRIERNQNRFGNIISNRKHLALSPMDSSFLLIEDYISKQENWTHSMLTQLSSAEAVMLVCGQSCPIPMDLIFSSLKNLQKLGEGVFGEVFSGRFVQNGNMRVYKVVAIEGNELVNGERQKTYAEILPEIIISQQLSKLHDGYKKCFTDGFIKLHNVRITYGMYPLTLINAWNSWNDIYKSDNDRPEFGPDQLYLVFEYDHGGEDVECYEFQDARQTFYLALQVAHILAVGECSMEMEHRDLHWGNILVEKTEYQNITYQLDGKTLTIPSYGVKACIIDFTIARIVDEENNPIFLDLEDDEDQFNGTGDHQFDIYRMMRELNSNEWSEYYPKTNVFWMHYLADKLFTKGRYLDTESFIHNFFMRELRLLKDSIMEYASCTDFVFSPACDRFRDF